MAEILIPSVPEKLQAALVKATSEVFKVQLGLTAIGGTPFPHGQLELPLCQVAGLGVLVLAKSHVGYTLCFPDSTCLAMMSHAFGRKVTEVDSNVVEGVLELVSILGARAKSNLKETPQEIERNIPVACIHKAEHGITFPRMAHTIVVPFKLERVGEFFLHLH